MAHSGRADFGAFIPGPRCLRAPTASGSLDGLTFAVKDLIDVAGTPTGGGNPDWLKAQPPAARSAPAVEALLAAGAAGVGLLSMEFLGGAVSQRFDAYGLSGEGRLAGYRSTLHMIAEHPWFGTGLGTFVWSFPSYRSTEVSLFGVWDRAHNTPLELIADLGIPLAVVIGLGWVLILALLIRGATRRRRDRMVPLAALSVALICLLHSMVDFSLQVPGYAIVAFAVVGVGLAQSFRTSTNSISITENKGSS